MGLATAKKVVGVPIATTKVVGARSGGGIPIYYSYPAATFRITNTGPHVIQVLVSNTLPVTTDVTPMSLNHDKDSNSTEVTGFRIALRPEFDTGPDNASIVHFEVVPLATGVKSETVDGTRPFPVLDSSPTPETWRIINQGPDDLKVSRYGNDPVGTLQFPISTGCAVDLAGTRITVQADKTNGSATFMYQRIA